MTPPDRPSPRWLDADEQRAWRALLSAGRLLMDRLERDLQADAGMPVTYYEVLVELSEAPERSMRMSELARRSLSSPSRLSHAVARLEELGWVRRQACPTDRRGAFAVLTDEGLRAIEAAAPGHAEAIRRHLFDHLSPAQVAEIREMGEALTGRLLAARESACTEAHADSA
ncbi:MAG: MarR family winged helix-turn-helix transcriptional regulator [Candidatus Dormibacteria bacterium]